MEIMGLGPARQAEHFSDVLDRLEREIHEEMQAPDQRVLASFKVLLDIE